MAEEETTYYFNCKHPKVDRETFDRLKEEGRSNTKTLNEMRAEVGLGPADCGGEVTIPLEAALEAAKPSAVIEVQLDAIDVESFRRAWERMGEAGYLDFHHGGIVAEKEPEIEIPKARIPLGKNLYSRKLRIRR